MEHKTVRIGKYTLFERKRKRKGGTAYVVSWYEAGHKHRSKVFSKDAERAKWVAGELKGTQDLETVCSKAARAGDYAGRFAKLDIDVQHALLGAWDKVSGAGGSADDILLAAEETAASLGGGITVGEAINAHLEWAKDRLARRSWLERRGYLGQLSAEHGGFPLCAFGRGCCRSWIEAGQTPFSRAHRHSVLSAFLNDCVRREWLRASPMMGFQRPKIPLLENVPIFTAAETERLFRRAEAEHPRMVPYLAFGLFAGLRPERELTCVSKDFLDMESRILYVSTSTTKTRVNRDVPIAENLAAWLEAYPPESPLFHSRRNLRSLVASAELSWSPDIMRHTYASYRLALTKDPVRVSTELGNSVGILRRHYANRRIPPEEVAAFWAIRPATAPRPASANTP